MVPSSNPTVLTQYRRAQKCNRSYSLCVQHTSVDAHHALAFQESDHKCDAVLGRHAQAHVDPPAGGSGLKFPSTNSTPCCRHGSRKVSPTRLRILPYNRFFRYFSTNPTWCLQSHRTCDRLSQLCMGRFSRPLKGAFPAGEPIPFSLPLATPDRSKLSGSSAIGRGFLKRTN